MSNKKPDSIIFDLDGTLWDATKAIYIIYNQLIKEEPFKQYEREIPLKEVKGYMGQTIESIGQGVMPGSPLELSNTYMRMCAERENKYLTLHNGEIFDGVIETLQKLSKEYKLLVVSNCLGGYIESFFTANDCGDLFIDYQWNTGNGITKGELNRMVIERNQLKSPVYVGDTQGDAISAKEANIPFILADYGFGQADEDLCYAKINTFSELLEKVEQMQDSDWILKERGEERLAKQMEFLLEVDKEKKIGRQTYLSDASRKENDAEHAWHLALMAMLLSEHANEEVDVLRVMSMVLIHDLVEIDAGDTYAYDIEGNKTQREREIRAANRIFSLLPNDQAQFIRGLWDEFEAEQTKEAKFARTLDKVQPILLTDAANGRSWKEHQVAKSQIINRNACTPLGSEELWKYFRGLIEENTRKGNLLDE